MLDWNDLRFAHAVARGGSLSAAARALGVHQATVGRRLDALEAALGLTLFVRAATGVSVTPDGAVVLASIDELSGALARFERGARDGRAGLAGLVRVAVTEATARMLVEAALPALLAAHPALSLELVPSNAATDLARGDADLAVRLLDPGEGLVARRLGQVRYGLYASAAYLRAHPLPWPEGLAGLEVLQPSRELARGPEAAWLAAHAHAARRRLSASSLVTLAHAVEAGLGACPLPTNLAALHPGARLVRALPEVPPRSAFLVIHPSLRRVARVRAVAAAVAEALRRRLA